MDVRIGLWRKLGTEDLMLLNHDVENTLESALDCKEIPPVYPKGYQSWIFIGRTDAEAETPIFWPPDVKNWLIGKDPDAGKDWRQEEAGMTEDEMILMTSLTQWTWAWVTPGVADGQEGLTCCSSWGRKELDMTEWLNWAELSFCFYSLCFAIFVFLPLWDYMLFNYPLMMLCLFF